MPQDDIFANAAAFCQIFVDKFAQNLFEADIRAHVRFQLAVFTRYLYAAFLRFGDFSAPHEKIQEPFVRHAFPFQEQFIEKPLFERYGNRTVVNAQFIDLIQYVEFLIINRCLRQNVLAMQIRAFIRHVAHELFVAQRFIHRLVEIPRRDFFRAPHDPTVFPRQRSDVIRNAKQKHGQNFIGDFRRFGVRLYHGGDDFV